MLIQLNVSSSKVSPHQAMLHIVAFRWQLDSLFCSVQKKIYTYCVVTQVHFKPKKCHPREVHKAQPVVFYRIFIPCAILSTESSKQRLTFLYFQNVWCLFFLLVASSVYPASRGPLIFLP